MAFILRSTKYINNFFGLARRSSLTFRRKRVLLLEHANLFGFSKLCTRTTATAASPRPVLAFPFKTEKAFTHLYNNLKASMVDLYTVELTLDSVKESGVITPSQLILLLKCCGSAAFRYSEEKRIRLAQKIWETAKGTGTVLDISHYNTLINVFLENNFKFSPEKILSEIREANLEPNIVTYRRLLKAFCQQGDIQGASDILEEMKSKKFAINEYDFCSLIQGHCEVGELEEAAKIFNVMKERGMNPTADPYVYLLCGHAKNGNIEKMEELLNELNSKDLRMTDAYLLNIVYTLIVNNQEEHVDSVLNRMNKSSNFEKTLMVIVHRLLHKKKDEEALKLFAMFAQMGFGKAYIRDQVHSIIDHFVFHRRAKELVNFCHRVQDEGWSRVAFSHGLKKAVLRQSLDYCTSVIQGLRAKGFPIRSHYFWPLIVRYSEQGNEGILAVLREMKYLSVIACAGTVKLFIKDYYKFSEDWKADLDDLKKVNVSENHACLLMVQKALEKGDMDKAELIASSYGLLRPEGVTIQLLVNCLANTFSYEKFLNILYCLAHDIAIYTPEETNDPEEEDGSTELTTFFENTFSSLISSCPKEVFLKMLQNASKKKLMITSASAQLIRENFSESDVDALLKEFESAEFELDKELLKKKSENAKIVKKSGLTHRIINSAFRNDPSAELMWEEYLRDEVSRTQEGGLAVQVHMAMLTMYTRMKLYDKAFEVIDHMENLAENIDKGNDILSKNFRLTLNRLSYSGDVEKMIDAYKVGIKLGFIDEGYMLPVIQVILDRCDVDKALEQYPEMFQKIKTLSAFLEVMRHLIPTGNTDTITKLTDAFAKAINKNAAFTALFTAYLDSGHYEDARKVLENNKFNFQVFLFQRWFRSFHARRGFEKAMEVVKLLRLEDRIHFYGLLMGEYYSGGNLEKLKQLWLQCQEDNVSEPYFLERLSGYIRRLESGSAKSRSEKQEQGELPETQKSENGKWSKVEDLLKRGKYTQDTLERLLAGKLPERIARRMLQVLAAEGKSFELSMALNKYEFRQLIPEIASIMLNNDKVNEFMEFVSFRASLKKYNQVYSCFASQKRVILEQMRTNEDFFQKFKELALESYQQGRYEAILVFLMKLCVQVPGKLHEAEELLAVEDERLVSHFRNHAVSDMLLNSREELEFYKNVLESEKVKRVFYEALDHFYDRLIKHYNEKGDLENALLYLEKSKRDGVDENLDKELISSLKKNLEDRGTTFPYPQLLQEAA